MEPRCFVEVVSRISHGVIPVRVSRASVNVGYQHWCCTSLNRALSMLRLGVALYVSLLHRVQSVQCRTIFSSPLAASLSLSLSLSLYLSLSLRSPFCLCLFVSLTPSGRFLLAFTSPIRSLSFFWKYQNAWATHRQYQTNSDIARRRPEPEPFGTTANCRRCETGGGWGKERGGAYVYVRLVVNLSSLTAVHRITPHPFRDAWGGGREFRLAAPSSSVFFRSGVFGIVLSHS